MLFQLVPKSTTLDDLERPYRTLLHKLWTGVGFRSSLWQFQRRYRPIYYQRHKCSQGILTFRRYKVRADILGVLWRGASNDRGMVRTSC